MKSLIMKMKFYTLFSLFVIIAGIAVAQTPSISWQTTIGGNSNDSLSDIKPTGDGGFIVCGKSKSNISGNKSNNAIGSFDYWVVKLDSRGRVKWNKTFGGLSDDSNPYIIQTPEGGYLVGGKSISNISGNKTENAINLSYDYWVIKLDKSGNVQWDNTIGGIQLEAVRGLAVAADNKGYLIAGYAHSNSGYDKSELNRGSSVWSDYWVVKLTKTGTVKWNKTYGGGNEDVLTSFKSTNNGGFIMGGHSYSPAEYEKTDSFVGNCDYWIVKIDANGNRLWDKTIGGRLSDYQTSVSQTSDHGYILGGYSNSPVSFSKTGAWRGGTDCWIVKTDSSGNKIWDKTIGGSGIDHLSSIQQTADGGYILGGVSNSDAGNEKSENSNGGNDIWIIKLDSDGNKLWDKTYGGTGDDVLSSIVEISSGEYIIGVTSNSPVSGDKTAATVGATGENDYWVIRLTGSGSAKSVKAAQSIQSDIISTATKPFTQKLSLRVSPNPVKDIATVQYNTIANARVILTVYDNNGKAIKQKTLAGGSGNYTADMSGYAKGLYYFVLTSGKSSATVSVIKE
jgi:hypothetical protein